LVHDVGDQSVEGGDAALGFTAIDEAVTASRKPVSMDDWEPIYTYERLRDPDLR
jgi:hypothetical protein